MSAIAQSEDFPRQLNPREAEILDFLLAVDDPRVEPLRAQRRSVVATGLCGCGCASINLAVDRAQAQPAALCSPPIEASLNRARAWLADPDEAYGLLLFLDEGWLSLLEIWWIQKPPSQFPPAQAFDPPEVTCERFEAALAEMHRRSAEAPVAASAGGNVRRAARAVQHLLGRRPTGST